MIFNIILALMLLSPRPPITLPVGADGIYVYESKEYLCTDFLSCYHEIGHLTDHENDMISTSNEFVDAVAKYEELGSDEYWKALIYPFTETNLCALLNNGVDERYIELYATILEHSAYVQMPQEFMGFYDWDRIVKEIETYKEHLVTGD